MSSDANDQLDTPNNGSPDTTTTDTAFSNASEYFTTDESILSKLTRFVRAVYSNPKAGFAIDAIAIGTGAFTLIVVTLLSIASFGNFIGTWLAPYSIFLGIGAILAYHRRFNTTPE